MAKQIKRIGVLTSGGDAPGHECGCPCGCSYDGSVWHFLPRHSPPGYRGLINGDIVELGARSVDGIISKGGTMLYTARCLEMLTEEGLQQAADQCAVHGAGRSDCMRR